jgi:hypothetical protein
LKYETRKTQSAGSERLSKTKPKSESGFTGLAEKTEFGFRGSLVKPTA